MTRRDLIKNIIKIIFFPDYLTDSFVAVLIREVLWIYFRPTFDDNRSKAEASPLLFMADTRYCAVSSKSHLELQKTCYTHTPLRTNCFKRKMRSLVNLQGVDAVVALHFVLPWLGHRVDANIVLVPKREERIEMSSKSRGWTSPSRASQSKSKDNKLLLKPFSLSYC